MTMHIYFLVDKDGYKKDWSGYIERTLARRFCENGIAIPYQKHLDNLFEAAAKEDAERKSADEAKKVAAALKRKEAEVAKKKNASSKKVASRSKAVK